MLNEKMNNIKKFLTTLFFIIIGISTTYDVTFAAGTTCQTITSLDLGVPADTTGFNTGDVDVSSKFNLPMGSILVKATGANTVGTEFKVSNVNNITFDMTGTQPVRIQAVHLGAIGAGMSDQIFVANGSAYTPISTPAAGIISGSNATPEYYVKNITASKIFSDDFIWLSNTNQNYIKFSTTSTKFNSRVEMALCIPIPVPIACGNGIVETGEECDDNNTVNGDGCSSVCTIIDTDGDGIPDDIDIDDDNDGIIDSEEGSCPALNQSSFAQEVVEVSPLIAPSSLNNLKSSTLGAPDSTYYSIGDAGSYIILSFGGAYITNSGNSDIDFKEYEGGVLNPLNYV